MMRKSSSTTWGVTSGCQLGRASNTVSPYTHTHTHILTRSYTDIFMLLYVESSLSLFVQEERL